MSRPPISCQTDDSLDEVVQRMWDRDCGVLPVVDDDAKVVGIVTDRDVCLAAHTLNRSLRGISVREAMSERVRCCAPDDTLEDVERLMRAERVRRIPVVDSASRLVGIVSLNDIARHAAASPRRAIMKDVTRTMAAVCEPRKQPHPGSNSLV